MDLIDKYAPQLPPDWANHIAQGGMWAGLVSLGMLLVGHTLSIEALLFCTKWPFLLMLAVVTVKKAFDYFVEPETVTVCVGKIIATVLWPGSLYGLMLLVIKLGA